MTTGDEQDFTSEVQLEQRFNNEIAQFWQKGEFNEFSGTKGIRINYAAFSQGENEHCLVIVPGRCEGYLKYKEVAYDLYLQGYDVFIIDHRGQGLSQRILPNKYKGYVESFNDYVDDLHIFIDTIVSNHCTSKPYILAHSMGGAITTRYLQKHQNTVKAAVLSSPMIAINSGALPSWMAKGIIKSFHRLNNFLSKSPWYFLGQQDYVQHSFEDNRLMQSPLRYQQFVELYNKQPELQLGGVTIHWLNEAIKTNEKIFAEIDQLKTPTLVLQAGDDTVIDNSAQNEFCQHFHRVQPLFCPEDKPVKISGARHEILFESDRYRNLALQHIKTWLQKY